MNYLETTYSASEEYEKHFDTVFISEINGRKAFSVYKIIPEYHNRIENIVALTKKQSIEWINKKNLIWNLFSMHRQHMKEYNVEFDNDWIEEQMAKYAYET